MAVTINDIINKRKNAWNKRHDIQYDAELVVASIRLIFETDELVNEVRRRPYLLIEVAFTIVDKKGRTMPFFLNDVQKMFLDIYEREGCKKPYYVLKGRQLGFTTLITAMQLSFAIVEKNFAGFTIADCADNTLAIFNDKARQVYNRLPAILKPHEQYNSRNELFFDKLNSSWRIATASDNVGRSRTLRFVHYSEIAFYEVSFASLQKGIGEACAADAFIVYETTANGFNDAKTMWDSGSCRNLFFGWWLAAEYRNSDLSNIETATEKLIDPKEIEWIRTRITTLREMGLEEEQIAWYCAKYKSYLDKMSIRSEYPISPEEAFVASGKCFFNTAAVVARLKHLELDTTRKVIQGEFVFEKAADGSIIDSSIKFKENLSDLIRIYRNPEEGHPYVVSGDTAGEGSDKFTAQVIDNVDGIQCATLEGKPDDDKYVDQMYCLGTYYNTALIAIESNFNTYHNKTLAERCRYKNMYMREDPDNITGKIRMQYGFRTDLRTRPLMLTTLRTAALDSIYRINDIPTLREMLTFIENEVGRAEAMEGCHDDLVMAQAIAETIRPRQSYAVKVAASARVKWEDDQWEDYRNASPEGKKLLIERWGNPA